MPLARVFPLEICNVGYNQCGEFTMHLFIHIPGAYDKQSKKKIKKRPVQHSSAFSTSAKDLARMRRSPQRTAFYHQRRITAGESDGTTIRESFTLQPRVAGEGSKT